MSGLDFGLAGQTVVVVGGGSGIGRAVADLVAAQRANVIVADRDGAAAEESAQLILGRGQAASACVADVTDEATLRAAVARTEQEFGPIQGLVNTAGITGPLGRRAHEVAIEEFDATYRVNLRGALAVTQAVLPGMLAAGYGRILHVASIAGKEGNPNMIGYSTTKAGLIGMVKALGKEYARDGVTINALAPAVIDTPFLRDQPADVVAYMLEKIPMGRPGSLDEVAAVAAFAISPAAGFTTGFAFDASGGRATY